MNCRGLLFVLASAASLTVNAQEVLIRGAHIYTAGEAGQIERGDVLIRDGKIAAVGASLPASGATVVEGQGRSLTPGLFAGITALGVEEVQLEASTVDENLAMGAPAWQMQWRPEFDLTLAFNPHSVSIPVSRIEGLTWTVVAPSGALLSGQGAAVSLAGGYDAVIDGSRSLFLQFGSDGMSLSAGSRAAQYMLFEQAVREVRSPPPGGSNALLLPAGREVLARYLKGGRFVFNVHRAADIRQVIALAKRHGIKAVIVGGTEAWMVAGELADAGVPVFVDPLENLPATFDRLAARLDNAAILAKAGVAVSFSQSSDPTQNARKIRQLAGNAVAHGMPRDAAIAGLTATPASVFGISSTHGQIAVGQSADVVLWSGDPLEVTSYAEQVWINGRPVTMRSRQTDLRDRYLERVRSGTAR